MGRLGRAVVSYPGFEPEGFRVVAAFDIDERLTGEEIGGLRVQSMREIPTTVLSRNVKIGIVTVPAIEAQSVIDMLVAAGVRSVLNYAPFAPRVPDGVKVRSIDPVLALQSMTYYLKEPFRLAANKAWRHQGTPTLAVPGFVHTKSTPSDGPRHRFSAPSFCPGRSNVIPSQAEESESAVGSRCAIHATGPRIEALCSATD